MTTSFSVRSLLRVAIFGAAAAVAAGLIGLGLERWHFGGSTDAAAVARIAVEVNARFADTARTLERRADATRATLDLLRASSDSAAIRELFRRLDEILADAPGGGGITIFDAGAAPIAWSGRVSDLPRERIDDVAATFAVLDSRGPRLVRVEPVVDGSRPGVARFVTLVIEQEIAGADTAPGLSDRFTLDTTIAGVAIRSRQSLPAARSPYTFAVIGEGTDPLAEADVSPESLASARQRWTETRRAVVFGVVALTLVGALPSIIAWRRRQHAAAPFWLGTAALLGAIVAARLVVLVASAPFAGTSLTSPLALLPTGLALAAIVWTLLDLLERWRLAQRKTRVRPVSSAVLARTAIAYAVVAAAATAVVWRYELVLSQIADRASIDLLRFSLHPVEALRLSVATGLVLLHAAVVWGVVVLLRAPAVSIRKQRSLSLPLVAGAAAIAATVVTLSVLRARTSVPVWPALAILALSGVLTAALSRPRGIARRASQSARLFILFLALLLPSIATYPSLSAWTTAAKERRVAELYAPQAAQQREQLQAMLPRAVAAIDAVPSLSDFVTSSSEEAAPTTDRAFLVWSQTELAAAGTTSAVELYGPNGGLVSWFALNLPEYGSTPFRGGSCDAWAPPYEETSPFGSSRRNVLRASRAICDGDRRVGAVVVRVMLDYRSLPFISSDNPYLESLRADRGRVSEAAVDQDLEFTVYGWSRSTIYTSQESVWPLPEDVFERTIASRDPFWAVVAKDNRDYRVYFFSDRNGVYAVGYPVLSALGHMVDVGELFFLVGILYSVLLLLATGASALTSRAPRSGRALLREVRSSFYRKLFLAFVATAVIPIVVLAFAAQRYFTTQYQANIEETAMKTATVAQRLVEDYAALQQRGGAEALELVDDQVMVLVRRAIDQDVNLFDRARLQATSERPLFASRLLPARTPGNIYRAIALDRLPASAAVEDIGGIPYLLAAAPVRTGGREGIVTVPQPLRSREIERQSDELNRRILSASVMFVLFASAIGYWMAERIADPVNRLSRATRRIARGDLDARIAATSSDELRRLVEDFNRMADDLKRQRADRERAQRLEAWADMARQVAHDIKNPLTPIQLSAEHARRVNIDRGSPLSPVLEECVNTILSQVRLLRQISAEFSSFASSPTAHPERAHLGSLIDEVVEPYRAGLASRVHIDVRHGHDIPEVIIDRTLLSRAMTNLIENALHAMPGGGTLTIATRLEQTTTEPPVAIEIRDTGVGMDQDAMRRLFEPYFSTKATGTGLGLTIAKRNIELIGGAISVESARGVGTVVTLRVRDAEGAQAGGPS